MKINLLSIAVAMVAISCTSPSKQEPSVHEKVEQNVQRRLLSEVIDTGGFVLDSLVVKEPMTVKKIYEKEVARAKDISRDSIDVVVLGEKLRVPLDYNNERQQILDDVNRWRDSAGHDSTVIGYAFIAFYRARDQSGKIESAHCYGFTDSQARIIEITYNAMEQFWSFKKLQNFKRRGLM